jgi:hypothetical protein
MNFSKSPAKGGIFLLTKPCADLGQNLRRQGFQGTIFVVKFSLTPFLKSGRSDRGYEKHLPY